MKILKEKAVRYGLKIEHTENFNRANIASTQDASDYARQFYFDDMEIFESFFLILLNNANSVTGYVKISQGGTAGTVVDVKLIAKYAIDSLAKSVILVHNHPSGNILPSDADKLVTRKVTEGLRLLDINVLDHIILSKTRYFSFADEGLI